MTLGVATLLRVSLLLATCAVWVIAEAQQEEDTIPEWLLANSGEDEEEATNIMMSTRKPKPGWVRGGTTCLNTDECGRGKCCLRRYKSPRRRCRRFQRVGEPCTEEQMMGGYYYGHCPCNMNGVCTYTNKGLRCVRKKKEQQPQVPPQQAPTQPPAIHPGSPPKEEEESEENQGKPSGPAKPSGQDNELPELEFENLRGPGDNGNAINPLIPSSSRNPPISVSSKPGATVQSGFGQGGNEVTPAAGTLPQGGTEIPGQPQHPALVLPTQPPNTPQGSGPSLTTQGASVPSPLLPPTIPGNSLLQPGGPSGTFPPPSMAGGNGGFPSLPGPQSRPTIPPQSPLPHGNNALPHAPEQQPLTPPPSPLPTQNANDLPPIVDEGPPPPPLPPSPLEANRSAGAD